MTKMSRQKHKCLENKKNFQDEIKSIFHLFYRAFIEPNKTLGFDFSVDGILYKKARNTVQALLKDKKDKNL